MIEPSDDEILARIEKSNRMMWRLVWILAGGVVLVAVAVGVLVLAGHADWQQNGWFQLAVAAVMGALVLYVLVMMGKHHVPPLEAMSPRLARRRIDAQQRRWRWSILLNVFVAFVCMFNLGPALSDVAALHGTFPLALGAATCVVPVMLAFVLAVGPGWQGIGQPITSELLNDEFALALRARTMRFGYMFAMLVMAALLLSCMAWPDRILRLLTWALFAGFAGPALYYVIADWRASRENEDGDV